MMKKREQDFVGKLLSEWEQVPEPVFGTAERVICACRSPVGRGLAGGLRLAYGCLAFGAVTGVVYAEWVSIRHDSLLNSSMSNRYLLSIDPGFGTGAPGQTK